MTADVARRLVLVVGRLDENPSLRRLGQLADIVDGDLDLRRAVLEESYDDLSTILVEHGADGHGMALLELVTEVAYPDVRVGTFGERSGRCG